MTFRQWDLLLNSPSSPGVLTREAICLSLHGWLNRKHGSTSFHLTQLMTRHGCLRHHLYRMRKRTSPECQHCGEEDDTVAHILSECPAWDPQRGELMRELNITRIENLTLRYIVKLIVKSSANWNRFHTFAITVMSLKEEEERRRCLERHHLILHNHPKHRNLPQPNSTVR